MSVKIGEKEYTSGLRTPTGEYISEIGTKSTNATIDIPSTVISSTNYLKSATIRIGDPNPAMIFSIPVNLQWNLQTRTFFRPANRR